MPARCVPAAIYIFRQPDPEASHELTPQAHAHHHLHMRALNTLRLGNTNDNDLHEEQLWYPSCAADGSQVEAQLTKHEVANLPVTGNRGGDTITEHSIEKWQITCKT